MKGTCHGEESSTVEAMLPNSEPHQAIIYRGPDNYLYQRFIISRRKDRLPGMKPTCQQVGKQPPQLQLFPPAELDRRGQHAAHGNAHLRPHIAVVVQVTKHGHHHLQRINCTLSASQRHLPNHDPLRGKPASVLGMHETFPFWWVPKGFALVCTSSDDPVQMLPGIPACLDLRHPHTTPGQA